MRSGLHPDGTPWQQEQKSHHGILEGTEHASQGPIHVFVHPGATQIAENARTFVVSHVDPATGRLTAPVVMLGFESPKQAQKAYQANFPRDRRKVGPIREMPFSQLRELLGNLHQNGRPASGASVVPGSKPSIGRSETPSNSGQQTPPRPRHGPLTYVDNRLPGTRQAPFDAPQATPSTTDKKANTTPHIVTKTNNNLTTSSPSAVARSFQGKGAYPGIDSFRDITIKKGTILYAGEPGLSGFFTTQSAFRRTGTNAQAIFEGLQVKSRDGMYRPTLTKFIVTQDTPAAFGMVHKNPQFGAGGLPQIYITNFSEVIQPIESYSLYNRMERLEK